MDLPIEPITVTDADDPRMDPFRLRPQQNRVAEGEDIVIDSEKVVLRAIAEGVPLSSIIGTQNYYNKHAQELSALEGSCDFYCLEKKLLEKVVGRRIHQGIMAVAPRPPDVELAELGPRILVLDRLLDVQNVGAIVRSCHAFGVDSIVVHPTGCSPFGRRAIRVSMGSIFQTKIFHSQDIQADLTWLQEEGGYQIVATANSETAVSCRTAEFASKGVLVIGNEDQGIGEFIANHSDLTVKIPVASSIDSLNAAAAAAVLLYAWTA